MGPRPKYGRNLHAVNAHFRRAGAFRDSRIAETERLVEEEKQEWDYEIGHDPDGTPFLYWVMRRHE